MYSPAEVTSNYVQIGAQKARYPIWKMLTLGVFAGIVLSVAAAVTNTAAHDVSNVGLARLISGLLFPFGLGIIIVAGAELFTGLCLLPIPVLSREIPASSMLKDWFFVYIGNLIGGLCVAGGCALFGQLSYSDNALAAYTIKLAASKCAIPFANGVVMGFFCNVLVCLGVFMALAAKNVTGRIAGAYLPVALFVICGFEHCVANMYYIPAGILAMNVPAYAAKAAAMGISAEALTWGNFFLVNLLPVTLGNILGGTSLACMMWFCHLRGKNKA